MTLIAKITKSMLGCALALSLFPLCAYADDVEVDTDSSAVLEERIEDEAPSKAVEHESTESEAIARFGIQDDATIIDKGDFGEDDALRWEYWDDATLVIAGTGQMPDFIDKGDQPWNAHMRTIESVIVEEGVTKLGAYAFHDSDLLTAVKLAGSLQSIGDHAFYDCDRLESVSLPNSVTEMGASAFQSCDLLRTCHLSDELEVLSAHAFDHCGALEHVDMPSKLKRIGEQAFYYCTKLNDMVLPHGLTTLERGAFWTCRVKGDIRFPNTLERVGSIAFSFFNVNGTVEFEENISQKCVDIIMGDMESCGSVSYPASLEFAPKGRSVKSEYRVAAGNPNSVAVGGVLFSRASNGAVKYEDKRAILVGMPEAVSGSYSIPDGTQEIGSDSLSSAVTSILIPASLTIVGDSFSEVNLRDINVVEDNPSFASKEGILYSKDMTKLIRCPRAHRFKGAYVMPDSVDAFAGAGFYYCVNLTDVVVSRKMTSFTGRFDRCPNLTAIYFPKEVTSIKNDCFDDRYLAFPPRNGLNVFYEGSESEWDSIKLTTGTSTPDIRSASKYFDVSVYGVCDDGLLYYVDHKGTLNIVSDEKAKTIPITMGDYAKSGGPWRVHDDKISSIDLSQKITSIGNNAFRGLSGIRSVTIPSAIKRIGDGAFAECPELIDIYCEGGAFSANAAGLETSSFDADKVTLHVSAEATEWFSSPLYDAGSKRWNGYRIVADLVHELPELSTLRFLSDGETIDAVKVSGVKAYHRGYEAIVVSAVSKGGDDITDGVDVAVKMPQRTKALSTGVPFGNYEYQNNQIDVVYDPASHIIEVGNCAVAGEYEVTVTPRKHVAQGQPVTKTFVVERAPEQIYAATGSYSSANKLLGRYASQATSVIRVDIWNQYCEDVSNSCAIHAVTDVLTGADVTDTMKEQGIEEFTGGGIRVDQFADPRDYTIRFYDPSKTLRSTASASIKLYRVSELLNRPYTLVLSGGSSEIAIEEDEEWVSTPYRVRVLDGYDDPCWPELDWKIEDSSGKDVTESFFVDEQGYLKVTTAALKEHIGSGGETFSIAAMAEGCEYKGASLSAKTRVSNELAFSLRLKPEEPAVVTHIATFKVGDDEIAKVAFVEGDEFLDEPPLPKKDNYIGTWDNYDLASAKADIVIEGRYTPMDPDSVSDIGIEGGAVYENGAVTIDLAATAMSRQVRIQSTRTKPLDVVLVCDQSRSMEKTLGSGEKKVDALKRCAKEFVTALYENADRTGADHRVALVGFACSDTNKTTAPNIGGYKNTGILVTNSGGFKRYGTEAKGSYGEALLPVSINGRVNQRLFDGISQIAAEGATAADCGLNLAKGIFAANRNVEADGTVRERTVVFITDGVPTDWNSEADRMKAVGTSAILIAKDIKQGQGAHIYSIGIDAQANPDASFTGSSSGVGYDSRGNVQYDLNRFLHAVSSNYPEASAMSDLGPGVKSAGYYMGVKATANLNKMFSSILYSTVYTIEAFDRATLAYTLPDGFVLTMKQEGEMRAALREQGLSDDDIVISEINGVTTIVFRNVKVREEYQNGVQRYVARVSFRVSARNGLGGSVSAGSASVDKNGDIVESSLSNVIVPQDRCVVVFKVNDAIYEMRDAALGDAIELPETDIARWMDLEKKVDPRVDSSYAVFETTTLDRAYTLRWVVAEEEMVETYAPGESVQVPDRVKQWIPADNDLIGWSPALPSTMPARNVTCTAVLAPKHAHSYTAAEYTTGSCTEGRVTHRVCFCGDKIETSFIPASPHEFDANLGCTGNSKALTVEELVCKACGHTIDKHITYTVSRSQWGGRYATVIDISKYENMVLHNGESDDDIEMRYYIGTSFYDQNADYIVTRIDEDGSQTSYTTKLQNGYLVFSPDHFSIYVIGEVDPTTNESTLSDMGYLDALSVLANPGPDEEPLGGPEEGTEEMTPDPPYRRPISDSPQDAIGWNSEKEDIDSLVNTMITSSKGVDLSMRSPKTGEIALRRTFAPLLRREAQAA